MRLVWQLLADPLGLRAALALLATFNPAQLRAAFRDGELGLDRYGLRAVLVQLGVEYVDYQAGQEMT